MDILIKSRQNIIASKILESYPQSEEQIHNVMKSCCLYNNTELLRYIIMMYGPPPFSAIYASSSPQILEICLEHLDVNEINATGHSVPHHFAKKRRFDIVRFLLSKYAVNVNSVSNDGETLLSSCVQDKECVRILIEKGAVPSTEDFRNSPYKNLMFRHGSGKECPICYNYGTDISTSCHHEFHYSCLQTHGENKCPICRSRLFKE